MLWETSLVQEDTEEKLKEDNRELTMVVAKLPFEPITLLRGISHRNLMGSDYTRLFLYFSVFIIHHTSMREHY